MRYLQCLFVSVNMLFYVCCGYLVEYAFVCLLGYLVGCVPHYRFFVNDIVLEYAGLTNSKVCPSTTMHTP